VSGGTPGRAHDSLPIGVRRARPTDREAVLGFASTTWDGWDYIPDAWPQWIEADDGVLLVAVPGGDGLRTRDGEPLPADVPIAVTRVALLAPREAWLEGIRVDPRVRGRSVATTLQVAELRWAAAQGATVIRYVTGERNEGSLRLGARHGFIALADRRSLGPLADHDPEPEPPAWEALRARLDERGLLLAPEEADTWWPRIADDPTFAAGDRLYEHRAWTLLELTRDRLRAHAAAHEVLALRRGGAWALAVRPRYSGWAEDEGIHLGIVVASDAETAAALVGRVNDAAALPHRVRFPDPGAPLLADGGTDAFAAIGYQPHDRVLKVLARPLDADHPLPEPDAPGLLELLDEPRPTLRPPAIG
jgi:GNAT superfamily N-acetyltransferase